MVDVTVDNPKVQVDLNEDESVTVPAGEQFHVTVACGATDGRVTLNGMELLDSDSGSKRSIVKIDLFGGDTITPTMREATIRGYRVD